MSQVSVVIDGKTFRMACEDGQEAHLEALGRHLDGRIGEMRKAFGEIGDLRLGNSVMLGAIADHLPFAADVLERCLLQRFAARKPALLELNRRAFAAGRLAAAQAGAATSVACAESSA